MKQLKKGFVTAAGTMLLASMLATSAWAAEDREKITSVSLEIDSAIEVGSDESSVNVTTSSSEYSVSEVEITNEDGDWAAGDIPQIKVTLEADSDYYFTSISSSKVTLKGDDAKCTGTSRSDSNSVLTVKLKLDALEGTYELDSVEWMNESSPVATWEDEESVDSYQVRLYRNGSAVASSVTTSNRYYDFGSSVTRTGTYSFKVRAYKSSSKHGDWYESSDIDVDEDLLKNIKNGNYSGKSNSSSGTSNTSGTSNNGPGSTVAYGWKRDNVGWWYLRQNNTYPYGGWEQINNIWYCFDERGYMRTGWILGGNNCWYYCSTVADSSEGAMLVNTWIPAADGVHSYYVDNTGVWTQTR